MKTELKITEQDLTAIRNGIYQMASTKDSGSIFTLEMSRDTYWISIEVKYEYEAKEVRGGSFEYWNGYVEYERCSEIINETYTIESLSAFCEEIELEVPNDFIQKVEHILNN